MSDGSSLERVKTPEPPMAQFERHLQRRGKRITQQRRILVECVFRRHEHFDADDLIEELARTAGSRRVSRPTVYRTLTELVEAGLLRKMALGGRAVYEHEYGYPQHDHLLCQHCNRLIEFQHDDLAKIREAVAAKHNFRVTGHRLIVTGFCDRCNRE